MRRELIGFVVSSLAVCGVWGCGDDFIAADLGGGGDVKVDKGQPDKGNGLPDGYGPLYDCPEPGKTCNAHDPCAITPICGQDKKCWPTTLMNCDDKLSCTLDTCEGSGLCGNKPKAGTCVLGVKTGGSTDAGPTDAGAADISVPTTVFKCFKTGDKNPADPCSACNPTVSDGGVATNNTKWMPVTGGTCDDKNACTKGDYCQNGVCKGTNYASQCADSYGCTEDLCDGKGGCLGNKLKKDWCLIGGTCYKKNAAHPAGSCFTCDPATSTSTWTPITNTCMVNNKCYTKGATHSGGCAECDPSISTTKWTVSGTTHCLISDACVTAGTKDSIGCASCDPTQDKYGYTALTGMCKIAGKCYTKDTADASGCNTCQPAVSTTTWSPLAIVCKSGTQCYKISAAHPGSCATCTASGSAAKWVVMGTSHCLILDTCYSSGASDPTNCSSCDPTITQYDWTPKAGYCSIQGKCHASGTKHPDGCAECKPTSNKNSWTLTDATACLTNHLCGKMCGSACAHLKTDSKHCGTCNNACPTGQVCKSGVCKKDCEVIASFEAGTWPGNWITKASGGTVGSAYAHDGSMGITDVGWRYNTKVSFGAPGDKIFCWTRAGSSGRTYLGFMATSTGAYSVVLASNTKNLMIQQNSSYNYTDKAKTTMTFSAKWYKLEAEMQTGGVVKATVYDSNGTTVLGTVSHTIGGSLVGGAAIRSFGSHYVDTITVCKQ